MLLEPINVCVMRCKSMHFFNFLSTKFLECKMAQFDKSIIWVRKCNYACLRLLLQLTQTKQTRDVDTALQNSSSSVNENVYLWTFLENSWHTLWVWSYFNVIKMISAEVI